MSFQPATPPTGVAGRAVDWDDPALYINRELSWLQFNARVLEEALDPRHPLLERVKFLAIFANNLDEFFMIRVSGLRRQLAVSLVEVPPDGMTPAEQLAAVRRELSAQLDVKERCWHRDLIPQLHAAGIDIVQYHDIPDKQRARLRRYFEQDIFPILTPLAFDPAHPFPHISNLSLNLAVVVRDPLHGERFARLKVPDVLPRLLSIPEHEEDCCDNLGLSAGNGACFIWLEDLVAANIDMLFPGLEILATYPFRITRDADLEIEEDEASDLLGTIEERIEMRQFGSAVRLEVDSAMPARIREILEQNLGLPPYLVYAKEGRVGLADLMNLTRLDRPDLKDPPFLPALPSRLASEEHLFTAIHKRDILLFHPYDSFTPVVDFVREAAHDPDVLAIKQTLYRVGPNSPIVDALMEARDNGKQVAVLVELKARFDEENNIAWARALEQAGVHVVYGMLGLKTHAKMCLVVRRERQGITRYVHLGTGNYNPVTSRVYTDIGYLTCDPALCADVSDLFNALTGYSRKESYRKLVVAPMTLRSHILERIEQEIVRQQTHGDGQIVFKMNALVDKPCIQALYRASQAGVKVDLQIRGICCLRPGVPGVSDNITVTSIVGRFLEHARLYYFHNGGDAEILLGSADLMPRNLDRRIEVLFPVTDRHLRELLAREVLRVHLRDTTQARLLQPDGTYERTTPCEGEPPLDAQRWMLEQWGTLA